MPKVFPFKAVRPSRDKVSLVASRSYETYTKKERKARLDVNPYSFLHIVNPGYKYKKEIAGLERFKLVHNRYQEFKEEGIFIQEDTPALYVYKIIDRHQKAFCGIIGLVSVTDYEKDLIKKHEDTLSNREALFVEYLDTVGFNAESVLLTYQDDATIAQTLHDITQTRADYEFTTTYRDTHYLWPVKDSLTITKLTSAFRKIDAFYIADGHHRSASSALLAKQKDALTDSPLSAFMAYLIPEQELAIYEFNRLVKGLNGLSKEELLIKLDMVYRIENRGSMAYHPSKKHHFAMYLDGEFYSLYLRKSNYSFQNALDALDTHILHKTILEPILGIKNPRTDRRLQYASGKKEMVYVKDLVDQGIFDIGFGMLPITMKELKNIADQGLKMPPKSTYIEPKLRSGLTIYEF